MNRKTQTGSERYTGRDRFGGDGDVGGADIVGGGGAALLHEGRTQDIVAVLYVRSRIDGAGSAQSDFAVYGACGAGEHIQPDDGGVPRSAGGGRNSRERFFEMNVKYFHVYIFPRYVYN